MTYEYEINGVGLVLTCSACPEQYDAYLDGRQIGYLRLRHGYFSVDYPDCGGKEVFSAQPEGDGVFEYDERMGYLEQAVNALLAEDRTWHQT